MTTAFSYLDTILRLQDTDTFYNKFTIDEYYLRFWIEFKANALSVGLCEIVV
jgi:hypothetical protein